MQVPQHVPVLLEEVLDLLELRPGATVVDATLGLAGHASAMARRLGAAGTLIGFDRDSDAMALAKARLDQLGEQMHGRMPRVELVHEAFGTAVGQLADASADALLADVGVSSLQLDAGERGFSFRQDAPLDMRMDRRGGVTAEQVVNEADEEDLANLIYEFGEERRSRRIARAIVRARPLTTTAELARVVSAAAPAMKQDRIHPATRTFQALRIYVNDELGELRRLLVAAPRVLKPGGRMAVISFHSLEDRLVKDAIRDGAGTVWRALTRRPVVATEAEVERNARARSAKLRVAERLGEAESRQRPVPPEGGSRRGRR